MNTITLIYYYILSNKYYYLIKLTIAMLRNCYNSFLAPHNFNHFIYALIISLTREKLS